MAVRAFAILLLSVCLPASALYAQNQSISDKLELKAKAATTWSQGRSAVVQLEGGATIELDRVKMSADQAVVWITPLPRQNLVQEIQIALLGNAVVQQEGATRSGDRLFVTVLARGDGISTTADKRDAHDLSASSTYTTAAELRSEQGAATREAQTEPITAPAPPTPSATTRPTTRPARRAAGSTEPVMFYAGAMEVAQGDDGNVAAVLTGGVTLVQRRPNGDYVELQADRVVLFTTLKNLKELNDRQKKTSLSKAVVSAYLEGDVRINFQPNRKNVGEQRLKADRVYYEFHSDRAVLTNAVIHTIEPQHGMSIIARAKLVRQLSVGEYRAEHMQLSTSQFAVPSLSLAADRMYVREQASENPAIGPQVYYDGQGVTFQLFDLPIFWMPSTSGSLDRGEALRSIGVGEAHTFGWVAQSEWGLFETLGMLPPHDLDVAYRLDYFTQRGPGFGVSGAYGGGFLTDTSKQPWDFTGRFDSYFVYDSGSDDVGRLPVRQHPTTDLRGEALWEHQHFFPDNWLAQVRAGWVSDATFMEEYFRRDFEQSQPHDQSVYLKHQDQNELFSVGLEAQLNKLVTTSNMQQEQFEVERLPEVRYDRVGEGLLGDNVTLFSDNRAGGMRFQTSRSPLIAQGFAPPIWLPGLPDQGTTGVNKSVTWRGDFREELDWPVSLGPIRAVPYVFGRYTQYSNSPASGQVARLFGGAGTRFTTEIWKTDPTIHSDLLDIHQLRHVIQPELNLFTSASTVDSTKVFIYDQQVDKINDISAAQFAIHQRWQTKRGGPGEWRSVDVLNFNVDLDFFANKPSRAVRAPYNFRGLYFSSLPEASIPRDALNADASYRISDNTLVLADESYNLDKMELQTIALGILFRRGERLSAYIGNRYIDDLDSNITSVAMNYELTTKYTINFSQDFDFSQGKNVSSSLGIARRFDTFYLAGEYSFDEVTGESGFSFNVYPIGLGQAFDTSSFQTFRR